MCYRNHQFNVAHPLTTHLLLGYFYPAPVADNPFISDSLIFTTMTFPVFHRPKDPLTEQTTHLGLISPVVDGFRLRNFTMRAIQNRFWGSQTNSDSGEVVV